MVTVVLIELGVLFCLVAGYQIALCIRAIYVVYKNREDTLDYSTMVAVAIALMFEGLALYLILNARY